ncbi:MAG: glycosyltransferase family 4 protein [Patescibacteria group bacterium]
MAVTNGVTNDSRVNREASALAEAGFEVYVVGIQIMKEQPLLETKNGFTIIRVPKFTRDNILTQSIWRIIRYYLPLFSYGNQNTKRLYQKMVELKADIYHANDLDTLLATYRASRKNCAHLVYDAHELYVETMNQGSFGKIGQLLFKKYYSTIERRIIKKCRLVLTVSQSIAAELARRYHIPEPHVIKNVPPPSTDSSDEIINIRQTMGIPADAMITLYQGSLQPGRGLFNFIDAMRLLPKHIVLLILGNGPLLNKLQSKVSANGLGNRIFFHPAVPLKVLAHYTKQADFGLVFLEDLNLNQHLALPNKLFEYMSVGLPIVASDLPEISAIVTKNNIGTVAQSHAPVDIANAILKLTESNNMHQCSQNSKKAFLDEFNWTKESKNLVNEYSELINDFQG